jgi:hypothetical protein
MTEEGVGLPVGAEFVLRAELNLLNRINLMLAVQSRLQKYFRSRLTQITCISLAVSSHMRAYRDRHGRGAGCDGRGRRF